MSYDLFIVAHKVLDMKKFLVVVMLACASQSILAQTKTIANLTGRWEAIDNSKERGGLEIIDSNQLYLVYGDQKRKIESYKADFSRSPAFFEFTVKDSTNTITLKSLIQLVNDDVLKWQIFDVEQQPVFFVSDRGDLLYLKRKKIPAVDTLPEVKHSPQVKN